MTHAKQEQTAPQSTLMLLRLLCTSPDVTSYQHNNSPKTKFWLQAAAEEQQSQVKMEAAVKFQVLYAKYGCWRVWLQAVQEGRARQQLKQQHEARQRGIQQFLQVSDTIPLEMKIERDAASVHGEALK